MIGQTGFPKGLKKLVIPEGRIGGVNDFVIWRAWGARAFWNFQRQGEGRGVKMFMPPLLGYGYFL